MGLSWSISFNPQKDLSFGNAPKLERLDLTDTVILHDDYVAQVSICLPELKHLGFKYSSVNRKPLLRVSFSSLRSLTIEHDRFYCKPDWTINFNSLFKDTPSLVALDLHIARTGKEEEEFPDVASC